MTDEEIEKMNKNRRRRDAILSFLFAVIIIAVLLLIHRCAPGKGTSTTTPNTPADIQGSENDDLRLRIEEEKDYKDDNPILVGLYQYKDKNTKRKLLSTHKSKWSYHNDIDVFETYYTHEFEISGANQKTIFDLYRNQYDNNNKYKIGYQVAFVANGKEYNQTILKPQDTTELFDYVEVYLYDDYHADGSWYSHVTENDYNENTLLTSIKLTAGKNVDAIEDEISLTVFTYDGEDDFNKDNTYRGTSKYTITVINEK